MFLLFLGASRRIIVSRKRIQSWSRRLVRGYGITPGGKGRGLVGRMEER